MQLLCQELKDRLPPLYSQEAEANSVAHAKFFCPWSNWMWYVTEGSPEGEDFRFFGFVRGQFDEWGYFLLSELESIEGPAGLKIERDLNWIPGPFTDVMPPLDE